MMTRLIDRKPTTRFEVMQLKRTMQEMLRTLDIDDIDVSRPTQVTSLTRNT